MPNDFDFQVAEPAIALLPAPAEGHASVPLLERLDSLKASIEAEIETLLATEGHKAALAVDHMRMVLTHIAQAIHVKSSLDAVLAAI